MSKLIPITILTYLALTGCVTPTSFTSAERSEDGYGYKVSPVEDSPGIFTAKFEGNQATASTNAIVYSTLAAFKYCRDKGEFALMLDGPKSYTTGYTYTSVNTSTSVINGIPYTSSYSYPVTVSYPKYAVDFVCLKQYNPLVGYEKHENISRELVHPVKKDFKGGVLITGLGEGKPSPFKEGDVILAIGKERVTSGSDIFWLANKNKPGRTSVEVIRDGRIKMVSGEIEDRTKETRDRSEKVLVEICGMLPPSAHNPCTKED